MKFKFREITKPKEQFSTFKILTLSDFRRNDLAARINFHLIILRIIVAKLQLSRRTQLSFDNARNPVVLNKRT